ncbi:MAG TPA: D-2-hydroxyacid dehydrogenase [Polyangiaceae bacterium]|nr:D-2-hydroxyacid dehydrogenase [Polyangiaceae bacterium]
MAKIFVGAAFPPEATALLDAGLASHAVTRPAQGSASNLVAGPADPAIAEADVVFGQPPPEALFGARSPQWVHLTSAGYTRYAEADVARRLRERGVALTTSSTAYAEPCATHALALLLALARRLPAAFDRQRGDQGWPADELRSEAWVLPGRAVLLLGFGAIGRRLAALLAPFGCRVAVVRDRPRGDEGVAAFDRAGALPRLGEFDAVVSSLPESASTRGFVDAAWLAAMKPGAYFVNVGRGTTVDQAALLDALTSRRLGGAALDVTDPEPLPRDHPLWTTPNVIVTPHMAGGRRDEKRALVTGFLENLGRFERGEALVDRVI